MDLFGIGLCWGMFGGFAGVGTMLFLASEEKRGTAASFLAGLGVLVLFPLLVLAGAFWLLAKAPKFLHAGATELRDAYWPKKTKLPEARLVR